MNPAGRVPLVIVLAALALAACVNSSGEAPLPTTPPTTTVTTVASPITATTSTPTTAAPAPASSYALLWPFATERAAQQWMKESASGGHQPWHGDPEFTALSFARDFLRYQGINRVTSTSIKADDAEIGVGFASDEIVGGVGTAAVVHLIRLGGGPGGPWEVVGTADPPSFSLTIPAYNTAVTSPVTVGGSITGVDESIRVQIRQVSTEAPLGETCCGTAGGSDFPWRTNVSFTGATDPFLTIAASTGGHIAAVERFAITGVHTRAA